MPVALYAGGGICNGAPPANPASMSPDGVNRRMAPALNSVVSNDPAATTPPLASTPSANKPLSSSVSPGDSSKENCCTAVPEAKSASNWPEGVSLATAASPVYDELTYLPAPPPTTM